MIIYDLICDLQHEFEGWFQNAGDLDDQREQGLLMCPVCESHNVNKKLAAPKLTKKSNTKASSANIGHKDMVVANEQSPEKFAELQKMLGKVHDYVEQNFTDVGNQFSNEAISIHRGEKDPANIRGTASKQQLKEMADEGVTALPLPPKPIEKDKLN